MFLEKYFLESVRHAKEAEFMRLHQGGIIVFKYAMKFKNLAHFYSQGIAEAWKCRKFAEGLKYDLKRVVVPMAITEFPALVVKAKEVERLEGGNRAVKISEGLAGSKKGGNQRKSYDRPQQQQGGPVIRQPSGAAGGGRQGGGATLRCYRCVGPHMIRDCPHTESHCFRCHQMGHELANCPTRGIPEGGDARRSGAQRGDTQRGDRPTTAGRVEEELLISAGQAESLLRDGAECCLLLAALSVETERVIYEIDVVRDFAEVFPDEVPRLPPIREMEFSIDLVPGAGPVSVAPYRMAPAELVELKGQLEDLLEKQLVRPSVSPWGAPILLVKKKDDAEGIAVDSTKVESVLQWERPRTVTDIRSFVGLAGSGVHANVKQESGGICLKTAEES
ncbi:uncharacterized protein LOC109811792 [Cajanus cajan]|uniref:uncharacterized protein LOC109811792 n=1 Tax=Cajanus cajan TaxID=3821 RepID=UPI00098D9F19|nr:uncharacterized protein LOC109811792 [Cajanus cajan]